MHWGRLEKVARLVPMNPGAARLAADGIGEARTRLWTRYMEMPVGDPRRAEGMRALSALRQVENKSKASLARGALPMVPMKPVQVPGTSKLALAWFASELEKIAMHRGAREQGDRLAR